MSLMVVRAGWGNTGSALLELADVGVDEEIKTSVRNVATKAISQAVTSKNNNADSLRVGNIQGVKAGQNYLMDVELLLPAHWTIEEARRVEGTVRKAVGSSVRGVRRVRVRFVPQTNVVPDFSDEFVDADAFSSSHPEPEAGGKDGHDHDHDHDHSHHATGTKNKKQNLGHQRSISKFSQIFPSFPS